MRQLQIRQCSFEPVLDLLTIANKLFAKHKIKIVDGTSCDLSLEMIVEGNIFKILDDYDWEKGNSEKHENGEIENEIIIFLEEDVEMRYFIYEHESYKLGEPMNEKTIRQLQIKYDMAELQNLIDTGRAWHMEGSIGRSAMAALKDGACILSKTASTDYWGNHVPSIDMVEPGSTGSLQNAISYWEDVVLHEDSESDEDTETLETAGHLSKLGVPISAMQAMQRGEEIDYKTISDEDLQGLIDIGEILHFDTRGMLAEQDRRKHEQN